MYQLLRILTETHPDPFLSAGGQVKFYIKADKILNNLTETLELCELQNIARKIVALVGDNHTFVNQVNSNKERIWLDFEPIEKKLILMGVYESKFRSLIGHFLLAVNGISVNDLISKMLEIRGSNGIYNNLLTLAYALKDQSIVSFLTGNSQRDMKKVEFTLMSFENDSIQTIIVSYSQEPPGSLIEHDSLQIPIDSKTGISYEILKGSIGYLRIDSMTKYRESFESLLKSGISESFIRESLLSEGFGTNGNIERIISEVPLASEAIVELLQTMNDMGIKDLLVDLSKNTGGNSYLTNILAYFLYGNKVLGIDT